MNTSPSVLSQVLGLLTIAAFLTAVCGIRTLRGRRLLARAEAPLPGRTRDVVAGLAPPGSRPPQDAPPPPEPPVTGWTAQTLAELASGSAPAGTDRRQSVPNDRPMPGHETTPRVDEKVNG